MTRTTITMIDEMSLSCPCCVCMECATEFDVHAWPQTLKATDRRQDSNTSLSLPTTSACAISSMRTVHKTGSISDLVLSDSEDKVFHSSFSSSTSASSSSSTRSSRSIRLSMDGSFNEHQLECPIKPPTFSPCRPVRRVASVNVTSTNTYEYNTSDQDDREGRQSKSLSRISSMSPRTPRMQRRCSVTKYSLESTFKKIQLDDHHDDDNDHDHDHQMERNGKKSTTTLAPCLEEEPKVQPRHRIQRRCSVTKYNLEDTLFIIQRDEVTNNLLPPSTSPNPETQLKPVETDYGLIATPESKRNFQAKLLWGRAA